MRSIFLVPLLIGTGFLLSLLVDTPLAAYRRLLPSAKSVLPELTLRTVIQESPCGTVTLASSIPSDGSNLALQSYSYCYGVLRLKAYIKNVVYNKIITLYYTDADDNVTPRSSAQLYYQSIVSGVDGWEFWGSSTPFVSLDGITSFVNLTFEATDLGQTYSQKLDVAVTNTGPALPSSTFPAPFASPIGFSQDITEFLNPVNSSGAGQAQIFMLDNVIVDDEINRTMIIAAQSYANPDYAFNWVRDASLTMDVLTTLYGAGQRPWGKCIGRLADILLAYATTRAIEQNDPDLQTGLGEPKFNLDNTVFTGPWGRPQNDGPATAAITLIRFANAYLAGSAGSPRDVKATIWGSTDHPESAPVLKDLLFIANNWSTPSFDLWEEESSNHFYTRMVQRRALVLGSSLAMRLGDKAAATTMTSAASDIAATLPQFWDPMRQLILYEDGPVLRGKYSFKDVAVLLGIVHGYANDGLFSYTDDRVLRTLLQIVTSFIPVFPIAATYFDTNGLPLGTPIGRYPEDTYNGTSTSSQGNPWYLCTATVAEILYRASTALTTNGILTISNTSAPFWNYFAAGANTTFQGGQTFTAGTTGFTHAVAALQGWGDAFIRTVKFYTPQGGHLSEEFDRKTGAPVGAQDLTWSYAALLTAAFARAEARGDTTYVRQLATAWSSGCVGE